MKILPQNYPGHVLAGGAFQRRHEPQDGQRAPDRAHEAPEAA